MNTLIEKKANEHLVLRKFYKLAKGQTSTPAHLDQIGSSIGITGDKYREVHHSLQENYLIKPFGMGYTATLTNEASNYIEKLNGLEEKDIILETLKVLRPFPNKYTPIKTIFDYIGVIDEEPYRKSILDNMYRHGLIEQANTGEWNTKISEKGRNLTSATYDLLDIPETKRGDYFTITGSNNNIIYKSTGSTINLSKDDMKTIVPQLLSFFNDLHVEDRSLLLAAVKDLNNGKEIDQSTFERITGLVANMVTIVTPLIGI